MKRYLLVPALLASLSTGCFTTIGAVAGSSKKTPAGNNDPTEVGRGALIGAVIDAVIVVALISAIDTPSFSFVSGGSERR